ncbi:MAG: energy transducer TonB [Bacteroidales bacterium]|jgi:protein TonB|nr:energy transducer TonB [Bacteroidales bacterium]
MELKKSVKADLENKRTTFVAAGLVIALGISLAGFEWKSRNTQVASLGELTAEAVEEEIIPITRAEEIPPPPPQQSVEVLNIVDDQTDIDNEMQLDDSEADESTIIDVKPVIKAKEEVVEDNEIFQIVEEMPEFPGGQAALIKWLGSNTKYPVIAQENGVQGTVYVQFVVEKDGSVTNATVLRGPDPSLEKEAVRVVSSMPKWKPGKQRNKAVRVTYQVPVKFILQNE